MTRISENQIFNRMLYHVLNNRRQTNTFSEEVASGKKVHVPGDSKRSATIAQFQSTLSKVEDYGQRAKQIVGMMSFQEDALEQANDVLIRAQEIATQGANETLGATERALLAEEVYELREHIVNLANSKYLGRYVFSGAADDTPAYSRDVDYVTGAGQGVYNYSYNSNPGSTLQRAVPVTDSLTITVNTRGDQIFGNAITALEELGRSLSGYRTDNADPTNAVNNAAYVFPTDYDQQTQDIAATIDSLKSAIDSDIMTERTNIAGRLRRIDTAASVLELTRDQAKDVLAKLQDADMIESASNLTQAQTALEASLTVTTQLLRQSILDYI